MKNLFFLLAALLPLFVLGNDEKVLSTNISSVTVFLNGAQVEREGNIYLAAGNYDLVIEGLPKNIDPSSINVTGKGNIVIMSIENRINYLKAQIKPKNVLMLEDSLELLQNNLNMQNAMLSVYNNEEQMILANKAIGGTEKGVDIAALKANAEFYRVRLTEIKTNQINIGLKIKNLNKDISRIQAQLKELESKQNQPTSEIVLKVLVKSAGNATIITKYNVDNAGWVPMYDIRAEDVGSAVKLVFKAGVFQNTGENWNKAKLTLSTSNPKQNNVKPVLNPWYLYFAKTYSSSGRTSSYRYKTFAAPASAEEATLSADKENFKADISNYISVEEFPINVEYKIDIPYTVESNGKTCIIQMQDYSLNAEFKHYAAPKIEANAFLLARITGWEKYNLLQGEANVFFRDTYVGKTFLNPFGTTDTLDVSMGQDKGISIKRDMIKDFTSDKFIGSSRRVTKGWEITVRNSKNKDVNIILEDQFPLSSNKDIEIEKLEYSGGTIEETTGKVTWNLTLKPNEVKKLTIKYLVKYPKEKVVVVY